MNKITWISVSAALIGVLMFGSYQAGQGTSTQASVQLQQFPNTTQQEAPLPQTIEGVTDEQWVSGPYRALIFEERGWQQISSEGGCLIYRSIGAEDDPATVTVMGSDREFRRSYTKQGARVQVCGLTVHLPPASSGISPDDDDG